MNVKSELNAKIEKKSLLTHPFYKAWESGELPVDALRTYAREYGAFIRNMPQGWETLNNGVTADEERDHTALWQQFAAGLDTEISDANLPGTAALVATSKHLFSTRASALGALYAFEAQQPATAASKLAGLRKHYSLPSSVEPYFETHAANQHEAEKLLTDMAALQPAEQAEAVAACEQMSTALWDA